jgi:iron uptake system component EfeO
MRALAPVLAALGACDLVPPPTPAPPPPASPEARATDGVKTYVDGQVHALAVAVRALRDAAPAPDADGWSVRSDADAVATMRARWIDARATYERVEGAIAILFPETDSNVDGRLEHVAERFRDDRPFDDRGFVGMHAVERILWSDAIAEPVRAFEAPLPGHDPPRTPRDEAEARAFRDLLCGRLVRDVEVMEHDLAPLALDPATAWRGIVGSIEEQAEKVRFGATGQDESRYAGHTLADMRANLEGGRAVLAAFEAWLDATPGGTDARARIAARFDALEAAYREAGGAALPDVPDGFDPDAPSDAHRTTRYGRLFTLLEHDSDPRADGSLASLLRRTGESLGIPPLAR